MGSEMCIRDSADHDRVDQRAQPVQMGETFGAVDVVGVAAGGGDAGVDRLTALRYHDHVVDLPTAQRPEDVLPGRRE